MWAGRLKGSVEGRTGFADRAGCVGRVGNRERGETCEMGRGRSVEGYRERRVSTLPSLRSTLPAREGDGRFIPKLDAYAPRFARSSLPGRVTRALTTFDFGVAELVKSFDR